MSVVPGGWLRAMSSRARLDGKDRVHDNLNSSLFRLMDWPVAGPTGNPISSRHGGRIGAYDARHREHLMALARQLTSSASLKKVQVLSPLLLKWGRGAARTVSARRCVAFESVSDSRLGFDETRPCRIGFDLLPQMCDVDTKILAMFFGFRPPDFAQDLPVR